MHLKDFAYANFVIVLFFSSPGEIALPFRAVIPIIINTPRINPCDLPETAALDPRNLGLTPSDVIFLEIPTKNNNLGREQP